MVAFLLDGGDEDESDDCNPIHSDGDDLAKVTTRSTMIIMANASAAVVKLIVVVRVVMIMTTMVAMTNDGLTLFDSLRS